MSASCGQVPQPADGMGEAHALKEGCPSIWDHSSRSAAAAAFAGRLANISPKLRPEFKDLTTAMNNWQEEIFSYFENPITNAYTESANNLAKTMNRMGRGYSFEVIRARMLYDGKARKDGSVMVDEPATDQQGAAMEFFHGGSTPRPTQPAVRRVVEYGPYIPTLTRLLEEGHFE